MGRGSKIDPATGRKKRESGPLHSGKAGNAGGLKRSNGKPVESRIDRQRRSRTQRGEIRAANDKSAAREKVWAQRRQQSESRGNSWWN